MTVIEGLLSVASLAEDLVKCYDAMSVEDWRPYRFSGGALLLVYTRMVQSMSE